MLFHETKLKGAFVIEPERLEDERGFFARTWCKREFEAHELNPRLVQCNISFNKKRGTLRGMHWQEAPSEEARLVRCTMGAVYDVIIDLRPDSKTHKQWSSIELTAKDTAGDKSDISTNYLAYTYKKKNDLKDSDFEEEIPF